jgi:CO/xanthine dehydrogenase Mo-binding subunit
VTELAGLPTSQQMSPGGITGNSAIPYKFPNVKTVCHRIETTPFRPSSIRAPGRMQNSHANESFMDELAAAAGADPLGSARNTSIQLTNAASKSSNAWPRSLNGKSGRPHRRMPRATSPRAAG